MISVSGIRGKIPEGLNLENILLYTNSFIETLKPKAVVVGRDSRPSGEFIEHIVTGTLLSKGINVIQLGIVPTPTVKAVVNSIGASGGIMISASHNPIVWNAFKFIGKNGFFLNQTQLDALLKHSLSQKFLAPKFLPKSKIIFEPQKYIDLHLESVLSRVDVSKIRKRKFKVFLDAVNGGGSFVVPALLEKLGCKLIKVYCEPQKVFPREPEPTPSNLQKTYRLMKKTEAEIGFALDPDADRLVLLTPQRGCISEEYTLPLSLLSVISKAKSTNMVINLSTSFVCKEILEKNGKNLIRSKVGEANVVSDMIKFKAFFGGEGNGGVIDPEVNSFGRDSLVGIAHILNLLALENTTIDKQLAQLPPIFMEKRTYSIKGKDLNTIYTKLKSRFPHAIFDMRDGLRIDLPDKWIHVRSSNTEPILRVIAESSSEGDLKVLFAHIEPILK